MQNMTLSGIIAPVFVSHYAIAIMQAAVRSLTNNIRTAKLADLDELVRMETVFPSDHLSRESFRRLLTRGHADVLVYDEGQGLLGDVVVLYRRGSKIARLYSLVVHPGHQGRGIARILLAAAERAAVAHGCTEIVLEVRPDNEKALRLYQSAGYATVRRIEDFYEDHTPAVRMSRPLREMLLAG